MSFEQRKHPRHGDRVSVSLEILESKDGTVQRDSMSGYMTDVSEGGISIEMDEPPPMGAEMDLHFELAQAFRGGSYVTARGTVVRLDEPQEGEQWGVGVEFNYLPEASVNILRDYVGRRRGGAFM